MYSSAAADEHGKGKTDLAFEDAGEHRVKNIVRTIHVGRWRQGAPATDAAISVPRGRSRSPTSPRSPPPLRAE